MSTGEQGLFAFMVIIGIICLLISKTAVNNTYNRSIDVDKAKKRGKRLAYEHKERYGEFPSWWTGE